MYHSPRSFHTSPRRGGRGRSSFFDTDAPKPGDRNILDGLNPTPSNVLSPISKRPGDKAVTITGLECIGSYNWDGQEKATIIVPGSPRKWRDRAFPFQVQPDTGFSFKDQNGHRSPKAVLLPLFKAVDAMTESDLKIPKVNWSTVDFITDRNNIRKLLRWIAGDHKKDFRIDTQLAGANTVLFNRWESRHKEEMSGYTYGFNFEKESTFAAPGCETATGHHRVLIYDLNGLKMIIRYEVDAHIPEAISPSRTKAVKTPAATVDDLVGALSNVKLEKKPTKVENSTDITVIHAGTFASHTSTLEMTTRTTHNSLNLDWKDAYSQLWISQSPHHFLARHERGYFTDVQKRNLKSIEDQELVRNGLKASIADEHIKLRRLLDVIKKLVVSHGKDGRLSLVCQAGELKVYKRSSKESCLPDYILQQFSV